MCLGQRCAGHERATQRHLVGIFEVVAHTQAAGQRGQFDGLPAQAALDIEASGVAFH